MIVMDAALQGVSSIVTIHLHAPLQVLVVARPSAKRFPLHAFLDGRRYRVRTARSVSEARAELARSTPRLLVLGLALPDGDVFDILGHLSDTAVAPDVVVFGEGGEPARAFRLAEFGVRAYVETAEALEEAIRRTLSTPPNLAPLLRATVGHRPLY